MTDNETEHEKRVEYHRRHSKMRAWARYGLELEDEDYEDILRLVKRKKYESAQPSRRSNQLAITLQWRGRTIIVAYRPDWGIITTFLPGGTFEEELGDCPRCNCSLRGTKQPVQIGAILYHPSCAKKLPQDDAKKEVERRREAKRLAGIAKNAEDVRKAKEAKAIRLFQKQEAHKANQMAQKAKKQTQVAWIKDRVRHGVRLLRYGPVEDALTYLEALVSLPTKMDIEADPDGANRWIEKFVEERKQWKESQHVSHFRSHSGSETKQLELPQEAGVDPDPDGTETLAASEAATELEDGSDGDGPPGLDEAGGDGWAI